MKKALLVTLLAAPVAVAAIGLIAPKPSIQSTAEQNFQLSAADQAFIDNANQQAVREFSAKDVTPPTNPLGGEVYKGKGLSWGNKDSQVWLCSDPKGGEWECSDLEGLTPSQARKQIDEANARNAEIQQTKAGWEAYGKRAYGNCPWTGCSSL